jgi:hypothetical protein
MRVGRVFYTRRMWQGRSSGVAAMLGLVLAAGCGGGGGGGDGDGGTTDGETSGPSSGDSATTSTPTSTSSTPDDGGTTGDPGPTTSVDSTAGESDEAGSGDSTGGDDDVPNVDVSDPQLYEFELDPVELDPTVVENIALQYAQLDTTAAPLGKLVFFLSGYTNTPASWRNHGRQLAGHGYHVLIPHYDNDWSCDGFGGTCGTDSRWEALVGEDVSPAITTSRADSAEGRVITMIHHLMEVHPGGDWGFYLDEDDNLRGEHVIIAGISHGAASTGLFATRRPFHRAVMHSGGWWEVGDDPATPIDAFYGLTHVDDEQHAGHLDAWENSGMLGAPTIIEDVPPPYGDSRRLVATTPNGYPHCSVCVSGDSPMDGDAYVFDPAWRYMYGAPQLP